MKNESISFEDILERDGRLIYTNVGTSMMPLLRQHRDLMIIERRPYNEDGSYAALKPLDAVLYRRGDKYILHRIMSVKTSANGENEYVICGDNLWNFEYDIRDKDILGVLTGVVRNDVIGSGQDAIRSDFFRPCLNETGELNFEHPRYRRYVKYWAGSTKLRPFYLKNRSRCLSVGSRIKRKIKCVLHI